jgi:RimJ/RimL family protein N-acetyltransferase
MKHTFSIEGYSYRLVPVAVDDAAFIVEARLEDAERNRFIHAISPDIQQQVEWIEEYYTVPGDYYFTVINKITGRKEGLISVYNISGRKGEWGRWVIKKDSLASVESFYLLCRISFEQLYLDEIYSRTIEDNTTVAAFHDSVNAKRRGLIEKCFTIGGKTYNALEHFVTKEHFKNEIRPRLEKILSSMLRRNTNK